MNFFLIDYENVKLRPNDEVIRCEEGDEVIVFFSSCCKNIQMDAIEDIIRKQAIFSCIEVYAGSGDALDFQLSSYLGYLIGLGYENANFFIVSNDKGYDCLCDFWQNLYNVSVKRLPRVAVTEQPKKPARPTKVKKADPTKVKKADFATIEEITELLSPNEYSADILKIINSYKTKQAIMNGISKLVRDSTIAGNIYKKLKPLLKKKNKS